MTEIEKELLRMLDDWEPRYKDKLGRIIESDELEVLLRNNEYRVVKQEMVGRYFVSTVWLGVPYGIPPRDYFETMVWKQRNTKDDPRGRRNFGEEEECVRYETMNEAEVGHEEMVQEYKNKIAM
jgi:hypothetical protein